MRGTLACCRGEPVWRQRGSLLQSAVAGPDAGPHLVRRQPGSSVPLYP